MISLDTNIIVRLVTEDDPRQARLARIAMASEALFLAKTVLLEIEWVLRYTYGSARPAIVEGFQRLLGLPNLLVEDAPAVMTAVKWYAEGLDFADALHLASSASASGLITFDRGFAEAAKRLGCAPPVRVLGSR